MSFKFVAIRVALVPAVLCALVTAPLRAERRQFSDTTDIVVVEVPITVTHDSTPVRGLTADNFEIKFDGGVQEIRSLEMIDLGPPTSGPIGPAVMPPIPARRHFLILFDLANSDPSSIIRARSAGRDLVRAMHPSDLVGVALYDNIQGVKFVLGFTSDRRQVDVALDSLGLPGLFNPVNDPLQLYLGEGQGAEAASSPPPGSPDGEFGRADSKSEQANQQIRDLVVAAAQLDRFESTKRVERMADSFEAMARSLASIEGQKYVVYMSEGFDSRLLLGAGDSFGSTSSIESGEIWNVNGRSRYGDTELQNDLERMMESLRRAGAVVQSVDIGGLRASSALGNRPGGTDVLNAIAQDTGGELYDNFNNLGDAMGLMLEATSVTYLATFQPKGLPMDGEYRKLKVKLKDAPRGAKISHRAGFYAPQPYERSAGVEKQLTSAQLILSDEDAGVLDLDVFAAPVPVMGEKAYVPLLLELGGRSLLAANHNPQRLQLQLFAYAFDDGGAIQDLFTELVAVDLQKVGPTLEAGGLKYWSHLDLLPGHYRVRVLVRDLGSGEYGVRSADVTVDPGGSSLLPVMAADGAGSWVMARESASRRREVPFPFLADGKPFIPRAKLSLPRSGTTDIIVQSYGAGIAGTDSSVLAAHLLDLDGNPVNGQTRLELGALEPLADAPDDVPGDAPDTARMARGTLETQNLDRGVYELVLTARGGAESRIRVEVQ